MPLITFNLQKIAHFWIGNLPVPAIKPWMGIILKAKVPTKGDYRK
jgi:hypothetical protein